MHSNSITLRFAFIIILVLSLLGLAGYFLLNNIYQLQLRNQANTVADNVSSFGKWVAGYGRVWVDKNSEQSFLGTKSLVPLPEAQYAADNSAELASHSFTMFSKNPALAQREFSEVVADSESPAKFRLTSDNFMSPLNEPDGFELQAINQIKQSGEGYFEQFLPEQGEYRFARAVHHKASCIVCHGDPSAAPSDVINRYGNKRGFGFSEGDLAGVISVTLPMSTFAQAALPFLGWREISLVGAAFFIAILFLHYVVLKPLKNLTRQASAASMGETPDIDLAHIKQNTRNEVEQLALSIARLNTSTRMAIHQMKVARKE